MGVVGPAVRFNTHFLCCELFPSSKTDCCCIHRHRHRHLHHLVLSKSAFHEFSRTFQQKYFRIVFGWLSTHHLHPIQAHLLLGSSAFLLGDVSNSSPISNHIHFIIDHCVCVPHSYKTTVCEICARLGGLFSSQCGLHMAMFFGTMYFRCFAHTNICVNSHSKPHSWIQYLIVPTKCMLRI